LLIVSQRVGALGFLAGSKVAADGVLNAGLLDQRKALKWVQKYIAKVSRQGCSVLIHILIHAQFGGDPDHVVLFGGSAGAGSVGLHLSAYGGRNDNLFVGAVGDAFFYPTVNNATYQEIQFDEFSSSLGCSSSPEQLACLRAVDINILQTANVPMQYPGQNLQAAYVWTPVVDGSFIVDNPLKLYQTGQFVKVPLISGDVTNEGTLFTPSNTSSNTDVIALVSANFPDLSASHLAKVSSLYPPTISHFSSAAAAYGDATFVCPGNAIAKYAGQFGNSSAVYKYLFNQPSTLTTIAGLGVPHNLDLGAIFGANVAPIYGPFDAVSAVNNAIQFGSFAPGAENAVSASIMQNYITSFVRFLDPNRLKIAVAPTWQPFATTRQTLVVANIGTNMYTVTNTTICDFWESVIPITRQ
jgi:acetylcholinesterase